MTRERTELLGRMNDLSREEEGNRDKIVVLKLLLEDAETRCSYLTDKAKASRFELRSKGEVEADIRRAMEAEAERRDITKAESRTGEEMAEEALEGETTRREEAKSRLGVATDELEREAEEAGWR